MRLATVILAAGEDTRFKSRLTKFLHPTAGKPMVRYVLDAALAIGAEETVLVIGKNGDQIHQALGEDGVQYVYQAERKGTGHATMLAREVLQGRSDMVLVCYGDMPLLRAETLQRLVGNQAQGRTVLTVLTLVHDDSTGHGGVIEVVEGKVCVPGQLAIGALDCGAYCFDADWLWSHVQEIPPNPAKDEYSLMDVVGIAVADGQCVRTIATDDPVEVMRISTRVDLSRAEAAMRNRINERLMLSGVTLQDPASTYVDDTAKIGRDTAILANTHITGETAIGETCTIGPNSVVRDSTIGNRCRVTASVVEEAVMEDDCDIGPFGHLRPRARMCVGAHMGNFGEMKNATLGPGARMGHFSYLGDTTVGAEANIGAGTITCNYDGERKHPTTIGENAFIGSGSMLVAPVSIGDGAKTGAGSVVTHDVPPGTVVYGVPARPAPEKKKEK